MIRLRRGWSSKPLRNPSKVKLKLRLHHVRRIPVKMTLHRVQTTWTLCLIHYNLCWQPFLTEMTSTWKWHPLGKLLCKQLIPVFWSAQLAVQIQIQVLGAGHFVLTRLQIVIQQGLDLWDECCCFWEQRNTTWGSFYPICGRQSWPETATLDGLNTFHGMEILLLPLQESCICWQI